MIRIICIGKIKEKYLKEAIEDYQKRISKYHKLEIIELPNNTIEKEKDHIKKYLNDKDYNITMEIEGHMLTSVELAKKIDKTFITHPNITFIIGGSDGLDQEIKNLANYKLSFSNLTFPHQLFRVLLLEQIYRSFKILNNETYHK